MVNIYNENGNHVERSQRIYDGFNAFILSPDRSIFNKLASKLHFYEMIKDLPPGDIAECGVFKGSGMMSWLKILAMKEPNSIRKVIGFDFFDSSWPNDPVMKDIFHTAELDSMKKVFSRDEGAQSNVYSTDFINNIFRSSGFNDKKYELVVGDIIETTAEYKKERPGAKFSIINMDLDLALPTYETLKNLWPMLNVGGVVIFDEYGYHVWTETEAADMFSQEFGVDIKPTGLAAPTAYCVKK